MKLLPRILPVVISGLVALAAASPASALTITPAGTNVTGVAATLGFRIQSGGFALTCAAATITGTTTSPADDTLLITTVLFVNCTGPFATLVITAITSPACAFRLIANSLTAGGASGTLVIPGTFCMKIVATVGLFGSCTATILPSNIPVTYVNATTVLEFDFPNTLNYVASGFPCGSGVAEQGSFGTAIFTVSPNTVQVT